MNCEFEVDMVGTEDGSGQSPASCQVPGSRKMFWRSASWSTSRSFPHNPVNEEQEGADPNGNIGNGQSRRFPAPITPRSQQNCKARSCLPPLQPLSIARRSLDEWPKAGSDDIGEWPLPSTPSGRGNGDRLKLDLSTIQKNPDKNGGLVKRDKIAFFDKECSKVAEHVYLGGDAVARDRDILRQNGITHILNCVGFVCPEYFKADFTYRTLWLQDSPSEDITSILYDVFDYFEDVREQGGRVFVHCCQGVSRSTSLVIAYLMWREGQSFDDAFQYVKAARGIADPNMGFACQLLQCQKRVHAFPLSPSSLLRIYRIAPHSPYDPLHLVPKMLNDPAPSALDSRGAFIIHIPSAIYLWIGKKCEAIMERDARGAACQIVRYERVQGPITVVKEGEEPSSFWDAFSDLLPLMYKSGNGVNAGQSTTEICQGERRIGSYNVDFEIFQKAISGGFVPPFASSENEHETHLPVRESSWSMLRRKFALGNMKEFVSAPRISLSRVYSDSKIILHSSAKSSSPSLLLSSASSSSSSYSSSYSPVYLSPDSISSDSSTSSKYFSESSIDSPPEAISLLPASSALSSFSNLSLSYKTSSVMIPNGSNISGARLTSEPCSQSSPSLSKKFATSLAERRGSFSKFLKLPMMSDKSRVIGNPLNVILAREDSYRKTISKANSTCYDTCNIGDAIDRRDTVVNAKAELIKKCKAVVENGEQGKKRSEGSCQNEATLEQNCVEPWRSGHKPLAECEETSVSSVMEETSSAECSCMPPIVYRWPGLAKIEKFRAGDLDCKSAIVFLSPSRDFGGENKTLYFWIGRTFEHDKIQMESESGSVLDDLGKVDWNQVGRCILTELGLPEADEIKVVREDEEMEEFRAMLSLL